MKRWFNMIAIIAIGIYIIDINLAWYYHPLNTMPLLKYTIIGLSAILFLLLALILKGKQKN